MNKPQIGHSETSGNFIVRMLSNKTFYNLLMILMIGLIILIFTRISFVFQPIENLFSILGFPIIGSAILYYLLNPLVNMMEERGLSKHLSILLIFVVMLTLLIWGILMLLPILQRQTVAFIENLPFYLEQIGFLVENLKTKSSENSYSPIINDVLNALDYNDFAKQIENMAANSFQSIGSIIGTLTQVVTGLITIPVVLYYLLLQGHELPNNIVKVFPTKQKRWISRVLYQSNRKISQYIRGQIIVAVCVGIMFAIGYSVIGLEYAVSLAVISGVLNIIPYLGSFIAIIPALIIALLTSPMMIVKVCIVLMVEQTLEGRFIQPFVLGNNLNIHPVTIILILLSSGQLFGLFGVIIGVPVYAVIKVIAKEIFYIYQIHSGLYSEVDIIGVDQD